MNESQRSPVVGIDWGTTNRRVYVFDASGAIVRRHDDAMGILAAGPDFSGSLRELLATLELDEADVLMSGMIGSRNGWREIPYLSPEQPISQLRDALQEIDSGLPRVRCRIVPGYCVTEANGLPDVMRGEETQIFGALALGATQDGWFVLPGTHSKWAELDDGRLAELMTFMTGELYALLGAQGTLAALIKEKEESAPAFDAGLAAAREGAFTHRAFTCRALVVAGQMPAAHAASFLSGLLIGTECREVLRRAEVTKRVGSADRTPGTVHVIGSATLAPRYRHALEVFGMRPQLWEPDWVYAAAIRQIAGLPAPLD